MALLFFLFLPRDAMHSADYAVAKCPSARLSVRLSVCLSHAGILSKRLNIGYRQTFFTETDILRIVCPWLNVGPMLLMRIPKVV